MSSTAGVFLNGEALYFSERLSSKLFSTRAAGSLSIVEKLAILNQEKKLVIFLQTPELGVTEHVAEDSCKFAVWTGKPPQSEDKRIIKVRLR